MSESTRVNPVRRAAAVVAGAAALGGFGSIAETLNTDQVPSRDTTFVSVEHGTPEAPTQTAEPNVSAPAETTATTVAAPVEVGGPAPASEVGEVGLVNPADTTPVTAFNPDVPGPS